MAASSVTTKTLAHVDFRRWAWWQLPAALRLYVGALVFAAGTLTCYAASQTTWHVADLVKYLPLLACALGSVAATPRSSYIQGKVTRDFLTVWVLPAAIVLPPVYAMMMPIPLYIVTQYRVHHGPVYRKAFSGSATALAYGAASLVFRFFPVSFAGPAIHTGTHALTWAIAVIACEIFVGRCHTVLLLTAVKLSDPSVRVLELELSRESLLANFAESDLGILITVVVAANPLLSLLAVPTIMLARRFIMHSQLLALARVDTKTGLLNSSTWETEAAEEVARAVRMRTPASLALIDIDHFKLVNDTHGHLVGDVALRAVTDAIREHLRSYDLAGRFGGEEFVVLLPNAGEAAAVNIAERLRTHIAGLAIPADPTGVNSVLIRLTISVGVATLDDERRELTDLMAAADAALYQAKQSGRNRTRVTPSKVPASQPAAEVQPTAPQHPSTASC
jgi:diguanylate cyclase (GGDEF)-like protein